MKILTAFLTIVVTLTGFQAIYSDLKTVNAATNPPKDEPVDRGNGRR